MMRKIGAVLSLVGLSVVLGCGGGDAPVKPTMDGPRDPNMKPKAAGGPAATANSEPISAP